MSRGEVRKIASRGKIAGVGGNAIPGGICPDAAILQSPRPVSSPGLGTFSPPWVGLRRGLKGAAMPGARGAERCLLQPSASFDNFREKPSAAGLIAAWVELLGAVP